MVFTAADPNLFRYVRNDPTDATDPTGLWEWKLDAKGHVVAISEKDDTLESLIAQGYARKLVTAGGKKAGIDSATDPLAAGKIIDLSEALPKLVQELLERQQTLPLNKPKTYRHS